MAEALVANAATALAERAALVQLRAAAAALRRKLGLAEDAPEQDVLNALDAARAAQRGRGAGRWRRAGRQGPARAPGLLPARSARRPARRARGDQQPARADTPPQPVPARPAAGGALTDGEEAVRRQLGLTAQQMLAARSRAPHSPLYPSKEVPE